MWCRAVIPALRKWRKEYWKFEASQSYIDRPRLKQNKINNPKIYYISWFYGWMVYFLFVLPVFSVVLWWLSPWPNIPLWFFSQPGALEIQGHGLGLCWKSFHAGSVAFCRSKAQDWPRFKRQWDEPLLLKPRACRVMGMLICAAGLVISKGMVIFNVNGAGQGGVWPDHSLRHCCPWEKLPVMLSATGHKFSGLRISSYS